MGAYADDAASTFSFSYNLVNGNYPDYADSSSGSDLWASAGTGNLDSDPGFKSASNDLDWTNDDFALKGASPCVDAGKPDVLDTDGSRSDCGAYGGPNGSW